MEDDRGEAGSRLSAGWLLSRATRAGSPPKQAAATEFRIGRVIADPARVPEAAEPGGWPAMVYYRLHGPPRMYWSNYEEAYLARLAGKLADAGATVETWCIFDNTASGAAADNALRLMQAIHPQ